MRSNLNNFDLKQVKLLRLLMFLVNGNISRTILNSSMACKRLAGTILDFADLKIHLPMSNVRNLVKEPRNQPIKWG